ncbi:hypothetical protein [Kineosporia sp. A_224]|uniref:hypothetical protein n=1 Tax=Kineosporia sp. A_224 TaxID=1962180 RepID=UPI000B4B9F32|nr:hypothetical protein [Kineosporia sp. A_224]
MDGCEWRDHAGVPYLYVDLRSTDEATLLARIAASEQEVARAGGAPLLHVDVQGILTSPRLLSEAKLVNRRTFGPQRCRVAVTGANALVAVIVRGWSTVGGGVRAQACPDTASALRYLTGGGQALAS